MKKILITTLSSLILTSCAYEEFTTECKVLSKSYSSRVTTRSVRSNYNSNNNTYGMPTNSISVKPSEYIAHLNCGEYGEIISLSYLVWRYTEANKSYTFHIKNDKVQLIKDGEPVIK